MNKMLLKYYMALHKDNVQTLAKALHMHKNTFYNKINEKNGNRFSQDEINAIKTRYNLDYDALGKIFLIKKLLI